MQTTLGIKRKTDGEQGTSYYSSSISSSPHAAGLPRLRTDPLPAAGHPDVPATTAPASVGNGEAASVYLPRRSDAAASYDVMRAAGVRYGDVSFINEQYRQIYEFLGVSHECSYQSSSLGLSYLIFRIDHLDCAFNCFSSPCSHFKLLIYSLFVTLGLLMVDGNGLLHPRGLGLACHLGILANLPTIGIGKNAMRSSLGSSKPIYVSIGHRLSLDSTVAVVVVKACCKYRIPEPIRKNFVEDGQYNS
ncbi:endonuclease V isoform X5 [Canna indica]|uniref:Endonuclease V isoform X5 n=1 Tax=Canna indica TaxID=4628 RepID=A0AAQ3K3P2_9LILI|nr:endonuclease V isoform X5 [Canna indica]